MDYVWHTMIYRLQDAGIMKMELSEAMCDPQTITVIEWSDVVNDVLPADVLQIIIQTQTDNSRKLILKSSGDKSRRIMEGLQ